MCLTYSRYLTLSLFNLLSLLNQTKNFMNSLSSYISCHVIILIRDKDASSNNTGPHMSKNHTNLRSLKEIFREFFSSQVVKRDVYYYHIHTFIACSKIPNNLIFQFTVNLPVLLSFFCVVLKMK